tara:strand:- start:3275 stop:3832 length:558 start_codon:yes stop_codon:yes gene_type:complete
MNKQESYHKYISRKYKDLDGMQQSSIKEVADEYIDKTIKEISVLDSHPDLEVTLVKDAYKEFTNYEIDVDSDSTMGNFKEPLPDFLSKPVGGFNEGMKFDQGKPDYSLVPFAALDEVVKVLTHGADKYGRFNWEKVEAIRYQAATMRHFSKFMQGEKIDPDSDIHHLAHAITSLMFMLDLELRDK